MTKNKFKAFTLIELLVVIAIIAILAGMVIVNLTSSRNSGQDAAVKAQMRELLVVSQNFYDANSYAYTTTAIPSTPVTGACNLTSGAINTSFFKTADGANIITGINKNAASMPNCALGIDGQSWAIIGKLRVSTSTTAIYWCVDSSGNATNVSGASTFATTNNAASCK